MPSLRKNIGWTTLLSLVGFILSFASQVVISYFFGASTQLDAYWTAYSLLYLIAFPVIALKEAVVPSIHEIALKDSALASQLFSKSMTLILIVASFGVVVALSFGHQLSNIFFSHNSKHATNQVVLQLFWLAPAIWLLAISETLNALLTSFHMVILQMAIRVISAISTLVVMVACVKFIGVYALAVGFVVGQLIMSLVLVFVFTRQKIQFRFSWPKGLDRKYFHLSVTLLIGALFTQLHFLYEKRVFSSFGEGVIAAFQYGMTLTNVLVAIIAGSLAGVFWPRFMDQVKKKDWANLYKEVSQSTKWTLLALGLLCTFSYLFADAIIGVIFSRGAFNLEALLRTSQMLKAAIFTAMPIAIITLLGRVFISTRSSKEIMFVGLSVAISGLSILAVAQWQQNSILAIHHWLLSNVCGCIFAIFLFIKSFDLKRIFYMRAFWWGLRLLIAMLLLIKLFYLFEIPTLKSSDEFFHLALNFFIFSLVYLVAILALRLLSFSSPKSLENLLK